MKKILAITLALVMVLSLSAALLCFFIVLQSIFALIRERKK